MKVNPGTKVTVVAQFTLAGAPGKFQPPSTCISSNPKDIVAIPVDDGAAGSASTDVDGNANGTGDSSIYTVTGDGDLGKGVSTVSGDNSADPVEWTDTVDIESDGVTVNITQLAPSTAAQKSKHVAALAA